MSLKAKKRFGQNFLKNHRIIDKIINAVDGNVVFEIGPGQGAITTELLARDINLTCIEIDVDCIEFLKERHPNLKIINCDVLKFEFPVGANVVGNLPYNIGTKIIEKFLYYPINSGVFMLQKEVAQRIMQNCRLGICVQAVYDIEKVVSASGKDFIPAPKVDSQVIKLNRHGKYSNINLKKLDEITRIVFSAPRKKLMFLKKFPELKMALQAENIDLNIRAEEIDKQVLYKLASCN